MRKYKMFFTMVLQALLRQKSRMFIALLAIAVGGAIISGMVTVYREVPAQLGREFRAYGANIILLPRDGESTFTESALSKTRTAIEGQDVVGLAPFLYDRLEINKQPTMLGGTDFDELQKVSPWWQVQGAYPKQGAREILLGREVAAKISREAEELIGKEVGVSAGEGKPIRSFLVTGIVSTGGKEEQFAYTDIAVLQELVEKESAISLAQLSIVAEGETLQEVESLMQAADASIEVEEVKQIARSEFSVLSKLQVLIFLVTIIVLLLTLICVTTTMMAVVTERRKEIGLKKALGASNKHIVLEFWGEGCLLGLFGGVLGSGLGYLFADSVSQSVFARGIDFSFSIALFSVVLSILVTGIASLLPVRIATSVDPAIVLRGE